MSWLVFKSDVFGSWVFNLNKDIKINVYWWNESLNSDGYKIKFHQYQQIEQSPLILTELTKHKKDHDIYDEANPSPGLGQAQEMLQG
jgi:hypothetical protein